ncbi:DUF6879 family protein [Streptomyces paludis]|uniref:DUF6879 family protein n=1 Tax=Streptomyces paludis TaxID=2282738 RepID=UPI001E38EA3C|nr:DUF6879 family protein [Streptomyces paludis]
MTLHLRALDEGRLSHLDLPGHETVVEIPTYMAQFFPEVSDGGGTGTWQQDPSSVSATGDPGQRPWLELMREITGRGVEVRRARIVSEPISEYIRFEHHLTAGNAAGGEQVRWLPRRRASDLALPGNDFWLLDGSLVVFLHFTGEGELSPQGDEERTAEPAVVRLCAAAFEAVWERAVPHEEYEPF